jgi:hypothetical protein
MKMTDIRRRFQGDGHVEIDLRLIDHDLKLDSRGYGPAESKKPATLLAPKSKWIPGGYRNVV